MVSLINDAFVLAVLCATTVLLQTSSTDAQAILSTGSCDDLQAVTSLPAQTSASPYDIQISSRIYRSGREITVTIEARRGDGSSIRELICQGRRAGDVDNEPVGIFIEANGESLALSSDFEPYNCVGNGVFGSTVGTSNADVKTTPVSLTYISPDSSVTGNIEIRCSFVQDTGIFYENEASLLIFAVPDIGNRANLGPCPQADDSTLFVLDLPENTRRFLYSNVRCTDAEDNPDPVAVCTPGVNDIVPSSVDFIICTCTDSDGLTSACFSDLMVADTPVITGCPVSAVTVNVPVGSTSGIVSYPTPVCTDVNGGNLLVTCSRPSGGAFPIGPTTVQCTCADGLSGFDSCQFQVLVIADVVSNQAVIGPCPQVSLNTLLVIQESSTTRKFFYKSPTCTEVGAGILDPVVVCSPTPCDVVSNDVDSVSCTCTGSNGVTSTCSSDPIVLNTIPLISGCPTEPLRSTVIDGSTSAAVTYASLTCLDTEEGALPVTCDPPSGSSFPLGTTAVRCSCVDNGGLESRCQFRVLVDSINSPPSTPVCPSDISTVSSSVDSGVAVPFQVPICTDSEQGVIPAECSRGPNSIFNLGNTAVICTCTDIGQLSSRCDFNVFVRGNEPPSTPVCPGDIITASTSVNGFNPVFFQPPTCPDDQDGTIIAQCSPGANSNFNIGNTVVVCTCTDTGQLTSRCTFNVIVTGDSPPSPPVCPTDINVVSPSVRLGTAVQFQVPICTDVEQGTFLAQCSRVSNSNFNLGNTVVTCTCSDTAEQTSTCTFNVFVRANSPPEIGSCPTSFNILNFGTNQFFFSYTNIPCTDEDQVTVSCDPPSGNVVQSRPTVITCICTDSGGNTARRVCQVDRAPPEILVCPSDQTVTVLAGNSGSAVDFQLPQAQDDSGFVYISNNPSFFPGFYFPLGVTTVTYVFSDAVPLTATCSFDVTVIAASPCDSNPCENGGVCLALDLNQFSCSCPGCFVGERCQLAQTACTTNGCLNGGQCRPYAGSCTQSFCECPQCFTGASCEISVDPCQNNQCSNGAFCVASTTSCDSYSCLCTGCQSGQFCQNVFDPCSLFPCQNGGICLNSDDSCATYTCQCTGCFVGYNCETLIPDPCTTSPCQNGGLCQRVPGTCFGYTCNCQNGFGGVLCQTSLPIITNPCIGFPCQNDGCCVSLDNNEFKCICRSGYTGILCQDLTSNVIASADSCRLNQCANGGTCYNSYNSDTSNLNFVAQYTCACTPEFGGPNCQIPVGSVPQFDECTVTGVNCLNGGTCRNTFCSISGDLGTFCECPVGFLGEQCQLVDSNRCARLPCRNGGQCTAFSKYFVCTCLPGFSGPTCEIGPDDMEDPVIVNCPIQGFTVTAGVGDSFAPVSWPPLIVTDNSGSVELVSSNGDPGSYPVGVSNVIKIYSDAQGNSATCQFFIIVNEAPPSPCNPSPCQNNGICQVVGDSFQCTCIGDFTGTTCTQGSPNPCLPSPCQNGGVCEVIGNTFQCTCVGGFSGGTCSLAPFDPCATILCQNGGNCQSTETSFTCQCPATFTGTFCEVSTLFNPCNPSPCQNGAACNVVGNTFQCICTGGFTGAICSVPPFNPCTTITCQNGGTCVNGADNFVCLCVGSFTGNFCEISTPSNPCLPSPCLNGAFCNVVGNSFQCTCSGGFTGVTCAVPPFNPCESVVCQNGGACVPTGATFTCQCLGSFTGSFCEITTPLDPCSESPCENCGFCEVVGNTFQCTCVGGYTGVTCSDPPFDPCIPSPCDNGGVCEVFGSTFQCTCTSGFTGVTCSQPPFDPCSPSPCQNNGLCAPFGNAFECTCTNGFTGITCAQPPFDPCSNSPCQNGGVCEVFGNSFQCTCSPGFNGITCSQPAFDPCNPSPCQNNGVCEAFGNSFQCSCVNGFTGVTCVQPPFDPCSPSPCQNNGVCEAFGNGFQCSCVGGFTGVTCAQPPFDPCETVICHNGGLCVANGATFNCRCSGLYLGTYCEVPFVPDPCSGNPCLNGGTFNVDDTTFGCECVDGFTGSQCQTPVGGFLP